MLGWGSDNDIQNYIYGITISWRRKILRNSTIQIQHISKYETRFFLGKCFPNSFEEIILYNCLEETWFYNCFKFNDLQIAVSFEHTSFKHFAQVIYN
jgi:hypothetical protein